MTIDAAIRQGDFGNVDSLLVIQHGKTIFDRSYPHDYARLYAGEAKRAGPLNASDPGGPYNYFNAWWHPYYRGSTQLHSQQSITKTITSVVIGVATTRGEFPPLDTPVLSFFDASDVRNVDDRKRHPTIRHLLTMSAGEQWNDDVGYADAANDATRMEASHDWVRYFIDRPMKEEPGSSFYYNDGAPATLAYVFRRATGQDMEQYAATHLFAPLGIKQWFWKRTPTGLPDGEGGLYLDRHDLAKLMILFQHEGVWDGQRIVSADWVRQSLSPAFAVPGNGSRYGYLWWLTPYAQGDPRWAFGGNGFGGQLTAVMKDLDTVIVVNAWNIGDVRSKRSLMQQVKNAVVGLPAR